MRFFEDESCGQCTPCRVGTEKAVKLMDDAALGRAAAERADAGHERRLDLRPRPGGDEPGQAGAEALPRGSDGVTVERSLVMPDGGRRSTAAGCRCAHAPGSPPSRGDDGSGDSDDRTDPLLSRRRRGRGRAGRDDLAGRRPRRASRSRTSATCRSPATAPTAIAAPAWSRSRASACSPPPASASRRRA